MTQPAVVVVGPYSFAFGELAPGAYEDATVAWPAIIEPGAVPEFVGDQVPSAEEGTFDLFSDCVASQVTVRRWNRTTSALRWYVFEAHLRLVKPNSSEIDA